MNTFVKKAVTALDAKLGRCPKCMRLSFLAMLAAGILALSMTAMAASSLLIAATEIIAAGAALLWLSHLVAYALRAVMNPCTLQQKTPTDDAAHPRRQFMFAFARSLVFVMAATAVFPVSKVFAQSCDCEDNMKCCWNYAGDVSVCAPLNANCCTHATDPWYCPEGHNCYGDSGCS